MLRSLVDFLLPAECRLCCSPLPEGKEVVCPLCEAALPRTGYHAVADNPMSMRFAGRFPFVRAAGHFYYAHDTAMAYLIQDFKYNGAPSVARHFGRLMARELELSGFLDDIDVLLPVPLHWTRLMRRGYNQTECLARGLSDVTGIPLGTGLKARRSHKSQTRVSSTRRLVNAEGIFRLDYPEDFEGCHILLMDDVCTTGATLTAAADAVLAAAPTARISLLTLAVTV